jgi:hypothetical protein
MLNAPFLTFPTLFSLDAIKAKKDKSKKPAEVKVRLGGVESGRGLGEQGWEGEGCTTVSRLKVAGFVYLLPTPTFCWRQPFPIIHPAFTLWRPTKQTV